jgi:hypothetical protein
MIVSKKNGWTWDGIWWRKGTMRIQRGLGGTWLGFDHARRADDMPCDADREKVAALLEQAA